MKFIIALMLFPILTSASTFTDKYHGEYKGDYKDSWFGPRKECKLEITYSHSEHLGQIEIRYHSFDVTFATKEFEVDGHIFNNQEVDIKLSERWFMRDFPHRFFEFTKYIGRKQYLVNNLRFKSGTKELKSYQLYTKGNRSTDGGVWGPPRMAGLTCSNLKRI